MNKCWRLVDLPGYGFAAGARKAKFKFNHAVDDYLKHRTSLCCVFALLDSGLPPQEIDVEFVAWLARNSVPFVLVFTKTDKVTPATVQANIAAVYGLHLRMVREAAGDLHLFRDGEAWSGGMLGVIAEAMTVIQAESEQAQPGAVIPPDDLATTGQKVSAQPVRKRRPISRAPGDVAGPTGVSQNNVRRLPESSFYCAHEIHRYSLAQSGLWNSFHGARLGGAAIKPIPLWPGLAPGETNTVSTEHDTSKPGSELIAGKTRHPPRQRCHNPASRFIVPPPTRIPARR